MQTLQEALGSLTITPIKARNESLHTFEEQNSISSVNSSPFLLEMLSRIRSPTQTPHKQNSGPVSLKHRALANYTNSFINLSIYKQKAFAFSSIKFFKKNLIRAKCLISTIQELKYIEKSIIIETCIGNFVKVIEVRARQKKMIAWFELKRSEKVKDPTTLLRYFARKFVSVRRAFITFKRFAVESKVKRAIVRDASERAGATRIYYMMLRRQILGFNHIKVFKRDTMILPIQAEFILFSVMNIFTEKELEVKRSGFYKIRFAGKVKALMRSRRLMGILQNCFKKLNNLALQVFQSAFDLWSFQITLIT